ncbi:uncharacterized protein [Haliotis asinina]|uniref:uncharacterized protein isoform X2 n=1 Tax=Haliotis asinina TaxID=109174 RepID=UPI0035322432
MVLHKEDSIQLKTALGTSEIQLLIGDITQLQQDEAVDIVMVSASQGNYSSGEFSVSKPQTLIGALSRNLKISVQGLSQDKELDLRTNFHCWVSKPLPHNVPYRRLVCFERVHGSGNGTTAQQISTMFRAMTPIFNNEDTTVITSLLATGSQGQSRVSVLRAMVDGACHWIKAGLPLRCLKIVLYASNPYNLSKKDTEAVKLFKDLKQVWGSSNLKQPEEHQSIDVFISHSNQDNHWADMIAAQLKKIRPGLKVYKQQLQFSADEVWQENVFHVMMQSFRIITILTPAYVESQECLEQFNIALCVDRLSAHHQIYPMYVETVACLPAYMQLVQYVECREHAGEEVPQTLIKRACVKILNSLPEACVAELEGCSVQAQSIRNMYDVFISYSHSYPAPADNLLQCLQKLDSTLTVFLDTSVLETGSSWQQSLYDAMDRSHCVVALLSPDYVRSDVCQEEYNIALARVLAGPTLSVTPREAQEHCRKQEFDEMYKLEGKDIVYKVSNQQSVYSQQLLSRWGQRVVFSFSHDSLRLAIILSELIKQASPGTNCFFISENNKDRLHLLDQAQLVVIIVSDGYVQSAQLLEELHLSLCRQRREKPTRMMYLIEGSHFSAQPHYLHLLDYKVSINDKLWSALTPPRKKSFKDAAPVNECFTTTRGGMGGEYRCSLAERLALSKAALEILDIVNNRSESKSCMNIINIASFITEVRDGEVPFSQCSKRLQMDDLDL